LRTEEDRRDFFIHENDARTDHIAEERDVEFPPIDDRLCEVIRTAEVEDGESDDDESGRDKKIKERAGDEGDEQASQKSADFRKNMLEHGHLLWKERRG